MANPTENDIVATINNLDLKPVYSFLESTVNTLMTNKDVLDTLEYTLKNKEVQNMLAGTVKQVAVPAVDAMSQDTRSAIGGLMKSTGLRASLFLIVAKIGGSLKNALGPDVVPLANDLLNVGEVKNEGLGLGMALGPTIDNMMTADVLEKIGEQE